MSKSSFKLRSGNSPLFKLMGSSPVKDDPEATHPEHHEEEESPEIDPATGLHGPPAPGTQYDAPDIQELGPAKDEEEELEEQEAAAPVKIYNEAGKPRKNYKY